MSLPSSIRAVSTMLLYIIRHGETDANLRGIIQGQLDTPLNAHGRQESALLAKHLKSVPFTEAYTSPLSRAKETAEIVIAQHEGLTVQADDRLKERCLGSIEGGRWPKGNKLPDDVEPTADFQARIAAWFKSFLDSHTSLKGKEPVILIGSHSAYIHHFLDVMLSRAFGFKTAPNVKVGRHCPNTSVTRVRCLEKDGRWNGQVQGWAEVARNAEVLDADISAADDV